MTPLVSILVPAFNCEDFLAETLASALAQTWPRTEIIIVDDGSTDRTLDVATRCAASHVKVVAQAHLGAAAARNAAYALSQGDYIQWLDADDVLDPAKIERQMLALRRVDDRWLLSSAWGKFMYRLSRAWFNPSPLWHDLTPLEWMLRKMEHDSYMQTATWLASRALTDAAGPWNTRLSVDDDGEFFCRVMRRCEGVAFVPDAKVFYRHRGITRLSYIGRTNAKLDSQLESMRLQINCLRSLDDGPRVRAACVTYLQNWLIHFYPQRPDLVAQADALARELGGSLAPPRLSWKYAWIERLGGTDAAKHAQSTLQTVKWSLARRVDRLLLRAGVP